ncbi:hypothetical protein CHU98_g10925 [Xylaria longipes]|nr:hypothetical protein CHU98_g10925 [Xylaria longipes]
MLSRGAPVGAVCLRCRLRLLRQLKPIRYVASDASNAHLANDLTSDRTDGENVVRDADRDQSSKARGKSRSRRLDIRKRHVSGNRVLNETAASLGSDMLGKPAYAIVMKDGGNLRKRGTLLAPGENESNPNSSATIEALVERQRESPTLREVRSNIEDLRPKIDKVLSEKEFKKLQRLLTDGFLTNQLKDYLKWYETDARRESQEAATDSSSSHEFPWIVERSPWVPLQTEATAVSRSVPTLRGYMSDTDTPKKKLAIILMRRCWGLSIAELQLQLGEMRVKLPTPHFILLMRGTQRFLNTLSKIWLEPGEKIEAIRNEETLRLVTTKPKADSLLNDLDKTLRSVTTKTFPVNLVASEAPDDAVLEELGRITNTHIRKSHTARRLHVSWIELESRAARGLTTLEDMSHVVLRLLLTAPGSPQATFTLLSPTESQEHSGRLIVDATSKEKLGWKDKLSQWARFVHPTRPEMERVANPALPIKDFSLPFEPIERIEPLEENREFFQPTKFVHHPVKWSGVPQTSTVACFGQVLHPYQSANPTPPLSDLLASAERRVFVPTVPHPLHLARFETSDADSSPPLVTAKQTLVLRFWPSPSSNPKSPGKTSPHAGDTPPAPILELRLAASDREVLGIESLRAIRRTHHTDVLLPSSLVDVRFTQTQYETLRAPDNQTLAEYLPLADFLGRGRLDLENGKVEVPKRQRFPIPRRLFASEPSSSSPTPTSPLTGSEHLEACVEEKTDPAELPQSSLGDYELISVSYEFVGLEFHRSATLPYEGHQLTYTSIEAGQGGGRRSEVILEPVELLRSTTPVTEAADEGTLQNNFLECCSRFVAHRSLWSGIRELKR